MHFVCALLCSPKHRLFRLRRCAFGKTRTRSPPSNRLKQFWNALQSPATEPQRTTKDLGASRLVIKHSPVPVPVPVSVPVPSLLRLIACLDICLSWLGYFSIRLTILPFCASIYTIRQAISQGAPRPVALRRSRRPHQDHIRFPQVSSFPYRSLQHSFSPWPS